MGLSAKCEQTTALSLVGCITERLPRRSDATWTDHGSTMQTQDHRHTVDRSYSHYCIRPATSRLNGEVACIRRTDEEVLRFDGHMDDVFTDGGDLLSEKPRK